MSTMTRWTALGAMVLALAILGFSTGCKAPADNDGDRPSATEEGGAEGENTGGAEATSEDGNGPADENGTDATEEGGGEQAADAEETKPEKLPPPEQGMTYLELDLPNAQFKGTPKNIKWNEHRPKPPKGGRKPVQVPEGVENVARGKPVTSNEAFPIMGTMEMVTDGDKKGLDGHFVELGPGIKWTTIDLGKPYKIHAIAMWLYHNKGCVYKDVIVQIASDQDFLENVTTVYNNDYDGSASAELGTGIGEDVEYLETYKGKVIKVHGVVGRYVRVATGGRLEDGLNHRTEVEVYAVPAE